MKRKPGEQAPAGEIQISEDVLRAERVAESRRLNENRNQEQLDRRNAIADEADDEREEEMADINGDRIVPRSAEDSEAQAEAEEREAQAERERIAAGGEPGDQDPDGEDDAETGDSKMINGVRHYLLVVKGKEKWLTLKQLRDTSSKVESADEYLQDAAESARRAVALSTTRGEEAEEPDTELEEMLNKALLGDPESVKKLARHLKATPSRVTPDVLQAVDERLTFREAVSWFESEFEDELKDPRLKQMIIQEDVRLRDANPTMGYKKRLQAAGNSVREWRNQIAGKPNGNGPAPTNRNNRLQRKQQMSTVPGAGGRQAGVQDEDAEEPVSAQIERMAAGRHQARAIKH